MFFVDVGLLSAMCGLRQATLVGKTAVFGEFKGALTENYVAQQLQTVKDLHVHYYANVKSQSEIDFVIDDGRTIVPIEVKAEINLQAKSLKAYREKYNPALAIRIAMTDYKVDGGLKNLPLYAIEMRSEIIE
jgi:predicted AAA+ superfamily ATPase